MVRESVGKRKAESKVSVPVGAQDKKKVRVDAPVKKISKKDASKSSTSKSTGESKLKSAPVKAVLPVSALKTKKKRPVASYDAKTSLNPRDVAKSKPKSQLSSSSKSNTKSDSLSGVRKEAIKSNDKSSSWSSSASKNASKTKEHPSSTRTAKLPLKSAFAKPGAKSKKVLRIHEVSDPTPAEEQSSTDEEQELKESSVNLGGFPDSIDDDSEVEDEEDDALARHAEPSVEETVRLPSSRDDAVVHQRLEQAKKRHLHSGKKDDTGVVYVGRLPHGFFEKQLRAYFSQFGDLRRLRLSRNKKTGHSKHYAFLEFDSREVAEIVVETMNNYLLDGHLLQMAMIPANKVDENIWIGANRQFRKVPTDRVERVRRSRPRTAEQREQVHQRLLQRENQRRAKLASLGIEYDFPGYQQ
ncbi:nucleolar protein [Malassezia yamatoensis]|uniref:Nucleolar protein n=1 Tax=Malassezia yamatoensis TaxID=253288 RepID=A0AAJ5YVC4_9BASI|nr:nucleolar protein [Malassezia yamatoensis]